MEEFRAMDPTVPSELQKILALHNQLVTIIVELERTSILTMKSQLQAIESALKADHYPLADLEQKLSACRQQGRAMNEAVQALKDAAGEFVQQATALELADKGPLAGELEKSQKRFSMLLSHYITPKLECSQQAVDRLTMNATASVNGASVEKAENPSEKKLAADIEHLLVIADKWQGGLARRLDELGAEGLIRSASSYLESTKSSRDSKVLQKHIALDQIKLDVQELYANEVNHLQSSMLQVLESVKVLSLESDELATKMVALQEAVEECSKYTRVVIGSASDDSGIEYILSQIESFSSKDDSRVDSQLSDSITEEEEEESMTGTLINIDTLMRKMQHFGQQLKQFCNDEIDKSFHQLLVDINMQLKSSKGKWTPDCSRLIDERMKPITPEPAVDDGFEILDEDDVIQAATESEQLVQVKFIAEQRQRSQSVINHLDNIQTLLKNRKFFYQTLKKVDQATTFEPMSEADAGSYKSTQDAIAELRTYMQDCINNQSVANEAEIATFCSTISSHLKDISNYKVHYLDPKDISDRTVVERGEKLRVCTDDAIVMKELAEIQGMTFENFLKKVDPESVEKGSLAMLGVELRDKYGTLKSKLKSKLKSQPTSKTTRKESSTTVADNKASVDNTGGASSVASVPPSTPPSVGANVDGGDPDFKRVMYRRKL